MTSDDFWGGTADWPTSEVPAVSSSLPADRFLDDAAVVAAGADTADPDGTYADLGEPLADDAFDDERWDAAWAPEPPRAAGIDPFVLRVGAVVVALTLAVPLFLGFRSDSDGATSIETTSESTDADPGGPIAATGASDPTTTSDDDLAPVPDAAATESSSDDTDTDTEAGDTADATEPSVCASEYDIVDGDFWIRIADGAGVELSELLAVNEATVDSALFPGSSICLPAGASPPPPPEPTPEIAAADSSRSAVSSGATATATAEPVPNPRTPPATAPPTTSAPTTTTPPTTASPTPPSDAVAVIRSVWPDALEERAITIAWRESNHRPDAYNGFCCYGLFQIYYDVHRSWLATDLGITSASQLFDPMLNAQAAYRLYERAGGWGPWAQTNY